MINLVCGDQITKIWIANVLFKYDYKLKKIENIVVPVGTTGVRGLSSLGLRSVSGLSQVFLSSISLSSDFKSEPTKLRLVI